MKSIERPERLVFCRRVILPSSTSLWASIKQGVAAHPFTVGVVMEID